MFVGTSERVGALLMHGSEVTSAFLFGRRRMAKSLHQPYMGVDHYRVLAPSSGSDPDLFDVLLRIKEVLEVGNHRFAFRWEAFMDTEDEAAAGNEPGMETLRDLPLQRFGEIGECQVAAKNQMKRAIRQFLTQILLQESDRHTQFGTKAKIPVVLTKARANQSGRASFRLLVG